MNQQRLMLDDYTSESPVNNYLEIEWQPIPNWPELQRFELKRSIIEREDNLFMAIDGLTNKEESFFKVEKVQTSSYYNDQNVILFQVVNLSLDAQKINRQVYNFLMLLGDVGGFYGIVSAFFAFVNGALTYQKADNLFVQTLFKAEAESQIDARG